MSEAFDLDNEVQRDSYREILVEKINNANALEFMVNCEGWQILVNSLEEKKQNQMDILMKQAPGEDEKVLRLHAIAFAVAHTVDDVSGSVIRAIEDGVSAKIALAELNNQANEEDENNWS